MMYHNHILPDWALMLYLDSRDGSEQHKMPKSFSYPGCLDGSLKKLDLESGFEKMRKSNNSLLQQLVLWPTIFPTIYFIVHPRHQDCIGTGYISRPPKIVWMGYTGSPLHSLVRNQHQSIAGHGALFTVNFLNADLSGILRQYTVAIQKDNEG